MSNHLRPRTAAELLDVAFEIIRAHPSAFGVLAVVVALPMLVGSAGTALLVPGAAEAQAGLPAEVSTAGLLATFVITIAGAFWFLAAGGSLVHATAAAFRGEPVEPAAALRHALSRGRRMIIANIYKSVVLGLAAGAMALGVMFAGIISRWALLAVIPAAAVGMLFLMARAYVVTPVVVLEDVRSTDALDRSLTLTKGGERRVALVLIVVLVVGFASALSLTFVGGLAGSQVATALLNPMWVLLYPLANVFETVVYLDQRIRSEGYDIELLSRQLDATPSLPTAPSGGRQPA